MSYEIRTPNGGYLTISDVDFKCPSCKHEHLENDYIKKLEKSEDYLTYINCKGCKKKLGLTVNCMSDVVVWLKSEEKELLNEVQII